VNRLGGEPPAGYGSTASWFAYVLARHMRGRRVATYFLNGAPRSGKTHLLAELRKQMPDELLGLTVFGPYLVHPGRRDQLAASLLHDLAQYGYLDTSIELPNFGNDLIQMWEWLGLNLHARAGQQFLILLDLDGEWLATDLDGLAALFSTFRALTVPASGWSFRPHHIIVGCWNQPALEQYFRDAQVSFPYNIGENYGIWTGLVPHEVSAFLPSEIPPPGRSATMSSARNALHGRILYELTAGLPGAIEDILGVLGSQPFTLMKVLECTQRAAKDGQTARRLVDVWKHLPLPARKLVEQLLHTRRTRARDASLYEVLRPLAIVDFVPQSDNRYIKLTCWYIELVLRLHASELGFKNPELLLPGTEVVPELYTYNTEAHRLVYDIEVLARQYATWVLYRAGDYREISLRNRVRERNVHTGEIEDLHVRTARLAQRSNAEQMMSQSALISFCTTTELSELLGELAVSLKDEAVNHISRRVKKLVPLRNAVMHNHVISESILDELYSLQQEFYSAIGD
jgi:hypothetical protein